jgi:hypothetical protein
MNWILEAYSNVYNVAAMQERANPFHAASAKDTPSRLSRLLGRRTA